MIFEISKQELNALYSKAEAKYYECLKNKGNEFLEEEILVPIASVQLKYSNVKVVFLQEDINSCNLEITLSLWVDSKSIGKYLYIEDDKGNAIDDSLILY